MEILVGITLASKVLWSFGLLIEKSTCTCTCQTAKLKSLPKYLNWTLYMLLLCTATQTDPLAEMHLQPELCLAFQLTMLVCWTFRVLLKVEYSLMAKMVASMKLSTRLRMDAWFSRKCKKVNHFVSNALLPSTLSPSWAEAQSGSYTPFPGSFSTWTDLMYLLILYLQMWWILNLPDSLVDPNSTLISYVLYVLHWWDPVRLRTVLPVHVVTIYVHLSYVDVWPPVVIWECENSNTLDKNPYICKHLLELRLQFDVCGVQQWSSWMSVVFLSGSISHHCLLCDCHHI